MTVVLARGVVPVDPERVHVAPGGFREGQATGGRMTDIVEVNRLGLLGTGNSLDGDVERPRDRYGPAHPGGLDADRLGFDSGEVAHQWRQGSHRPAALSASDRRERFSLLGAGPLIHDHADRPVSGDHRARGVQQHGEAQAVELRRAMRAALHMEDEAGVAVTLGRPRRQAGGRTRADGVAAARFEIVAADLPLGACHDDPPSVTRVITSGDRSAMRSRDRVEGLLSRPGARARSRRSAQSNLRPTSASRPRPLP